MYCILINFAFKCTFNISIFHSCGVFVARTSFYRFLTATAFSLTVTHAIARLNSHTFGDNAITTFTLTASHAHILEEKEKLEKLVF